MSRAHFSSSRTSSSYSAWVSWLVSSCLSSRSMDRSAIRSIWSVVIDLSSEQDGQVGDGLGCDDYGVEDGSGQEQVVNGHGSGSHEVDALGQDHGLGHFEVGLGSYGGMAQATNRIHQVAEAGEVRGGLRAGERSVRHQVSP